MHSTSTNMPLTKPTLYPYTNTSLGTQRHRNPYRQGLIYTFSWHAGSEAIDVDGGGCEVCLKPWPATQRERSGSTKPLSSSLIFNGRIDRHPTQLLSHTHTHMHAHTQVHTFIYTHSLLHSLHVPKKATVDPCMLIIALWAGLSEFCYIFRYISKLCQWSNNTYKKNISYRVSRS